jgi:hypothetical protein
VNAWILRQFRVEGGGHGSSLPNRYGIVAFGCDYFHVFADVFDFGGADEDHFDGRCAEETLADGAIDLASVGVAADADVQGAEAHLFGILNFGCEKDRTGARSERGLGVDEVFQLGESVFAKKFEEGAGLSAGDDEAIDGVKLLGFFDEDDFGAEFFETAAVGVEITLQGQDSYFHNGCWAWGVRTLALGSKIHPLILTDSQDRPVGSESGRKNRDETSNQRV